MSDDNNSGYKISDRLLRLSTPRMYARRADGGGEMGGSAASSTPHPDSPTKLLTAEQIQSSVNRMYSVSRHTKELPPLVKSRTLSKEEEEKSTHRLYHDAMETQKKKRALSAERLRKAEVPETKKIPQEEVENLVRRMHDQVVEVEKRKAEALASKYSRPTTATAAGGGKVLSKSEANAVGTRLCNESSESLRSKKAALYDKYVLSKLPKKIAMGHDELVDASSRLSRNEPRAD